MPPNLAGRARRSRSMSFGGGLPVKAGISLVLIIVSSGKRLGPMSGIVRVSCRLNTSYEIRIVNSVSKDRLFKNPCNSDI